MQAIATLPATLARWWAASTGALHASISARLIAWAEDRPPDLECVCPHMPWKEWRIVPLNRILNLSVRKQVGNQAGPHLWKNPFWEVEYHMQGGAHLVEPRDIVSWRAWGQTKIRFIQEGTWIARHRGAPYRIVLREGLDGKIGCWTFRIEGRK